MQKRTIWNTTRSYVAGILMPLMAVTGTASAASHVISPSELAQAAAASSKSRQQNLDSVSRLLNSEQAREGLAKVGMDPSRVVAAVAQLSDEDAAKLAARVDSAQADFAAGRLSERDLLWVIVAIAALILIIVAVR